ncbi:hypothetical protein N9070_00445 [bacterium]|nr:hypothetical protein [bacterium]
MAIDISAQTRRVVYTGASGTGPYAFAFNILVNTDIAVYYNTTELTLTTDYTVSISADGTGSVTLVVGTNIPTTPDADDRITIVGDRTIERSTDFTTGGPLFAQSLNDEFDSLTIFTQQNLEQSDRSLRAPNTDPTTINMELPINTVRANKTLAFDNDGNPTIGELIGDWRGDWAAGVAYNKRDLIKDTSNDNVYICQVAHTSSGSLPLTTNADYAKWDLVVDAAAAAASAAAAAASASAAATSETNAETAETNAETAETNAAASASAASTSETNAATSESNAASSASTASTAATNAGTSETNAASSASAASTSASSASTSASTATTQASNASTSASSASTSATTATTQASNASTSATNAASSASAASSSASAASTSATNAATSASDAQAIKDSIDEFYLGAQASDPTLDNNGDPVTAGDWYFNTTADETRIYSGSAWQVTAISSVGFLTAGNNLSDVLDAGTSRTNLGLGTAATTSADAYVGKTSTTGSGALPSGTEAQRDGSPAAGYIRFNSDSGSFEGYDGSAWGSIGGGASAGGAIYENTDVIDADYTLTTGSNGMSVGPMTIDAGVTVTVPSGQRWVIL